MKQIASYLFAGILGGLVVLGGLYFLQLQSKDLIISTNNNSNSSNTTVPVNTKPSTALVANSNATVPSSFTEAANLAMPVVVHISASSGNTTASSDEEEEEEYNPFRLFDDLFGNPFNGPQKGTGSGVIYSSDGYIITNNHVIEFADKVEVTLFDNRTFDAVVVGKDKKTDLAVLKIEGNNLPTLKLANSDLAQIGEWVLAVGNPFDLTSTVTAGIISAKGRSLKLLKGRDAIESFIQTDAAVNPGNSGGALVDANGRLLGINTAIATKSGTFQGYSFAIPVNLATRIVDDIIEYGSFQRAFLGVNIYPLNSEEAESLGVDINQGVVIDELVDGGSAQYAGLQPKDIIVKVDGIAIKDVPELSEIVGRAQVDDVLNVTVIRKGDEIEIPVRMRPSK